ncbi:DUF624 domain-containing protein [Streptococcus cameli]
MGDKTNNAIRTIFGVDNAIVRTCERILDLVVLNLLFLLSCLPIVTIGVAKMTLYKVLFVLHTKKRLPIIPSYIATFKMQWKQGLQLGLLELGLVGFCALEIFLVTQFDLPGGQLVQLVAIALLILVTAVFLYVFPMASYYDMSIKEVLKTSFLLAGLHFPWTFLMVGVILLLTTLLYTTTLTFLLGLSLLLVIGISGLAYGQVLILKKIFAKYALND